MGVDNGENCETSYNVINTNCNKNSTWNENKFCRHSCYYTGNGYEGDNCCKKKLSEDCIICNDIGTTYMIKTGNNCASFPDAIEKKLCRLTCYNSGNGYEGDVCCNNEAFSLVPSMATTLISSSRSCEVCDNSEPEWMVNNGKDCASFPDVMKKNCNKNSKWIEEKFCRLTCYNSGNGYKGDVCCNNEAFSLVPSMTPTLISSSRSCEVCENSEPEWMVNNGKECTTSYNVITTNCNKNANWSKNKFCRLSCYNA